MADAKVAGKSWPSPPDGIRAIKDAWQWRNAITSPDGPPEPNTRFVLLAMSLAMNADGAGLFIGARGIAKRTGLSLATVTRHRELAVGLGYLVPPEAPRNARKQLWTPCLPPLGAATTKSSRGNRNRFAGKSTGGRPLFQRLEHIDKERASTVPTADVHCSNHWNLPALDQLRGLFGEKPLLGDLTLANLFGLEVDQVSRERAAWQASEQQAKTRAQPKRPGPRHPSRRRGLEYKRLSLAAGRERRIVKQMKRLGPGAGADQVARRARVSIAEVLAMGGRPDSVN